MVFSSLLFLYLFFPLNLLCYHFMPDLKWKNRIMLIFSLIFYAWAGPAYLLLLIGMTFADWVVALQMSKNCGTSGTEAVVGHRLCHQHRPAVYL